MAAHPPTVSFPQPTEPQDLVLPIQLQEDIEFTVKVRGKDDRTMTLSFSRFLFDGDRWIATIKVPPPAPKSESD
ncbi:MAG: hypothetical protein ACJAZN_002225 [Planctomycetota bacterium]|jgi:hypothetical protein